MIRICIYVYMYMCIYICVYIYYVSSVYSSQKQYMYVHVYVYEYTRLGVKFCVRAIEIQCDTAENLSKPSLLKSSVRLYLIRVR